MTVTQTRTLAVSIEAPFDTVVADLADPATHPLWAKEFFAKQAVPGEASDPPATADATQPGPH